MHFFDCHVFVFVLMTIFYVLFLQLETFYNQKRNEKQHHEKNKTADNNSNPDPTETNDKNLNPAPTKIPMLKRRSSAKYVLATARDTDGIGNNSIPDWKWLKPFEVEDPNDKEVPTSTLNICN